MTDGFPESPPRLYALRSFRWGLLALLGGLTLSGFWRFLHLSEGLWAGRGASMWIASILVAAAMLVLELHWQRCARLKYHADRDVGLALLLGIMLILGLAGAAFCNEKIVTHYGQP